MSKKQLWAAVVYIVAIAVPAAALAARFGFETEIDLSSSASSLQQLLSIGAALVAAVAISLLGSRLSRVKLRT